MAFYLNERACDEYPACGGADAPTLHEYASGSAPQKCLYYEGGYDAHRRVYADVRVQTFRVGAGAYGLPIGLKRFLPA